MCFHHDEYADCWSSKIRKARTDHSCESCYRKIQPGELCYFGSGIFDGNPFSLYVCGECMATRYRIHLHELERGCREYESWAKFDEIIEYCDERNFPRSDHKAGQAYMTEEKKLERLKLQRTSL